ncbi:MAG: hypothetical protein R2748_18850 [Bryobacterales bacterium]
MSAKPPVRVRLLRQCRAGETGRGVGGVEVNLRLGLVAVVALVDFVDLVRETQPVELRPMLGAVWTASLTMISERLGVGRVTGISGGPSQGARNQAARMV